MAIEVTLEVDKVRNALGQFARMDDVRDRVEAIVYETANYARDEFVKAAPRSQYNTDESKSLRHNIQVAPITWNGNTAESGIIFPPETIFTIPPGTQPHTIPIGGSAEQQAKGYPLHFFTANREEVYAWSVNHPGYNPTTDWVADTLTRMEDPLMQMLNRAGIGLLGITSGD